MNRFQPEFAVMIDALVQAAKEVRPDPSTKALIRTRTRARQRKLAQFPLYSRETLRHTPYHCRVYTLGKYGQNIQAFCR